MSYMPKIIPIKDLKNTSGISELCHSTDEPVFITKNGYSDMVVMSNQAYDKLIEQIRIWQSENRRRRLCDRYHFPPHRQQNALYTHRHRWYLPL